MTWEEKDRQVHVSQESVSVWVGGGGGGGGEERRAGAMHVHVRLHTFLKKSVVKAPPSIAMSPNIFFWLAFFRMFSSTVLSDTNLQAASHDIT